MGWWERLMRIFQQKSHAAMNAADDPLEALDLVYYEQSELLAKCNNDLAVILSSEKRLQRECEQLDGQAAQYDTQAREALAQNDEKKARLFISRWSSARDHRAAMEAQDADVRQRREQFEELLEELRAGVERLRLRRQAASAQAAVSRATIAANEGSLPIGPSGAGRAMSLDNASGKLTDLRSRAESLMQLRKSGQLDPVGASEFDSNAASQTAIDARLAELQSGALPKP
ncbi:MAG: hypothetical protein NVSMB31_17670 [Vulcanimicrobiaceae bacterium]